VSLESRLSELAVEWPETPDVAARVRARLEGESGPARLEAEPAPVARPPLLRRLRPAIAVPLAALVLVAGGVAAVPSARSTVLRWLGLEGVKIERVPKAPTPAPTTTPLDLGERSTLTSGVLVPRALGPPDAVYRDGDVVTLLYRPRAGVPESANTGAGALLTQFRGRTNPEFVRKQAGPATTIERVSIGGQPGYWLAGAAHGLVYEDPSGDIRDAPARLAGNTLVWRRGELTLRLEADIPKERALAIARSIR
jgi:hypothetical protein